MGLLNEAQIRRIDHFLLHLAINMNMVLIYEETFAPVVKMTTVQKMLAIAASQSLAPLQMYVKQSAFLLGDLKGDLYEASSQVNGSLEHEVCKFVTLGNHHECGINL